jgi:hypothetical protein
VWPNLLVRDIWFWSHLVVLLKSDLDVQQTGLWSLLWRWSFVVVSLDYFVQKTINRSQTRQLILSYYTLKGFVTLGTVELYFIFECFLTSFWVNFFNKNIVSSSSRSLFLLIKSLHFCSTVSSTGSKASLKQKNKELLICKQLRNLFWPNHSGFEWNGTVRNDIWGPYYKKIYGRNLRILVIS